MKTGINIDRVFGGVRPGLLLIEELMPPGIEWDFKMDMINIKLLPEPEDPKECPRGELLKSSFDVLINLGVSVRAKKSIGCGLLRLKEAKWVLHHSKCIMDAQEGLGDLFRFSNSEPPVLFCDLIMYDVSFLRAERPRGSTLPPPTQS
ncbi:MAG: hypothetical protein N3H31_07440 [Candidatus Nezhaarchaeota archaeon]|nr:hypothetical protein [Candidatus Nezhaarchaeota archaeon]